tara:strand:+ start:373 stop:1122 length:750 start_codon:yes stop_codon:yes gene_type:complete
MIKKLIKKILPNFFIEFVKKFLVEKVLNEIKSDFKNINHNSSINMISELCEKYGSDKGFINHDNKKPYNWRPHTYASYYYSIFNLSKENIKLVFECGLGTNNPKFESNMTSRGVPGASLRVWRDYFLNADIYGGDIDKNILFEENRIKTFFVDQLDTNSIKSMWDQIKVENFDIIIDDGLHDPQANLNFFFNSFHKLKKNGVFIIEDVSFKNINILKTKLTNYDIDVVTLSSKYKKYYLDNNLIVIRKS